MRKKIGIVAEKLSHSLSPSIHNYWIKKNKIVADYLLIELEKKNVKNFYNEFNDNKSFLGFNITVPYKETFFNLCPNVSDHAKAIGSINLIYKNKNSIYGENTDYLGFKKIFEKLVKKKVKTILVVGAGGASRAILKFLNDKKIFDIDVYSRSISKRKSLKKKLIFKNFYVDASLIKNHKYDLIINASTSGMLDKNYLSRDIYRLVKSSKYVIDIVYNPIKTKLIKEANTLNIPSIGGLTMLLEQAAPSFNRWFKSAIVKTDGYIYRKISGEINE